MLVFFVELNTVSTEFQVLWSGLYPSQKHLAWLLCSGIIHDRLAAARAPFICIRPIPLSCALRNSAFGLRVRVISRHTYKANHIAQTSKLVCKLENATLCYP